MIIDLTDKGATDNALTGGKAAELARLIALEFPVPGGFVITTEAFTEFIETNNLRADIENIFTVAPDELETKTRELKDKIKSSIIPQPVVDELEKRLSEFKDDTLWAVRSSGVAEDLEGASFAGQYDTILGVRTIDEVVRAVRDCWASFFNEHSIRYRRERDIGEFLGAVIVQQLVASDAAGVCFSVDPLSGDSQKVVINANYGLGESVVSGIVTPDTFTVDKVELKVTERNIGTKEAMVIPAPGGSERKPVDDSMRRVACLTDKNAIRIAELAIKVENAEKRPVDIEWALRDEDIYLLQSRPITSLGADRQTDTGLPPQGWEPELNTPIDPRFPLYSNGNISEVLPGCITPLSWSYIGPTIEHAFRYQGFELGSMLMSGPEYQVLGFFFHRPYICVSFMEDAAARIPGTSPDMVREEFVGPVEKPRPGITLRDLLPDRWPAIIKVIATGIRKVRSVVPDTEICKKFIHDRRMAVTPEKLKEWSNEKLLDMVGFSDKAWMVSDVHIWASSFAVLNFSLLRQLTKKWLDDQDGSQAARMVTAIGTLPSADPAFGLYKLAMEVLSQPHIRELFQSVTDNDLLLQKLHSEKSAKSFLVSLNEFLGAYGHRAVLESEFRNPCWREDPAQVMGLVRNYLQEGVVSPEEVRERQDRICTEAAELLNNLSWPKRAMMRHALESSRKYIGLRELLKDLLIVRSDIARQIYCEIADRLVSRKLISCVDDIYFLVYEEVWDLLLGKLSSESANEIIARRRHEFELCEKVEVPKLQEGVPKFITAADFPVKDKLEGMGVSPGVVEGRARVILDPRVESHIEPGEILVAPVTDAGWTPLFINAAGLVVDVGGLLSHGSVVAREYGLPAVVGVTGATKQIKTGDLIHLDGSSGLVVKLD